MRSIRRVGGVAVAGLLLTALTASSATAQTAAVPASYTGSASGFALKLAGPTAPPPIPSSTTEGFSTAKASSDGTSEATGAGVLGQANTTATAKNPPGQTVPAACGDAGLNQAEAAVKSLFVLGTGCGSAAATGSGLATTATATGTVASIDLDLTALRTLGIPLPSPTIDFAALNAACNALSPLPAVPAIPVPGVTLPSPRQACLDLVLTLTQTVQSIIATKTLEARFGESTSGVSVSGTTVTSESTAAGTTIKILPLATLNGVSLGEPLATISIARAQARVACNLDTGTAMPSFDPAIVRVKLASSIAGLLPALPDLLPKVTIPPTPPLTTGEIDPNFSITEDGSFTVTPGAKVVLFPGLPIQSEIVAGAGSSKVNPDGSANAVADGVKVHLLQNIGATVAPLTGGLLLNLAHAEAAGACVRAVSATAAPPAPPVVPEVARELPRTGGNEIPWLPIAGVAGLALAVISRRAVLRTR